jgi:ABC-type uncharacterized transport system substrate-binding protein
VTDSDPTGQAGHAYRAATKFQLAINPMTAKVMGLTIPESFLLRADEVIE